MCTVHEDANVNLEGSKLRLTGRQRDQKLSTGD